MVAADGRCQLIRQVVAQTTPGSYLGGTVKLLPTQLLTGQHLLLLLLLSDGLRVTGGVIGVLFNSILTGGGQVGASRGESAAGGSRWLWTVLPRERQKQLADVPGIS